ncbi:MAG: glycyl-radical enzyme activating protein [Cellulosilyticaceae bacterium]
MGEFQLQTQPIQTGIIFNIQKFSVHDGPGIRTTVFMKGCPLRCKWCHNPEGLAKRQQLQYMATQCIGCQKCAQVCQQGVHTFGNQVHLVDAKKCTLCEACMAACPAQALVRCGDVMTVQQVMQEVLEDQVFYGETGGVTFSGGEALMQSPFVTEVLSACKAEGIHTAIDTSGYCKWEDLERTLPYCDLYLYDIKSLNLAKHKELTGVEPTLILENLKRLDAAQKPIWIRVPVIGGLNANEQEMREIAQFIKSLSHVAQTTLMPYHVLGKEKYQTLGRVYDYDASELVTQEMLLSYQAIFVSEGILLK